MAAVLQALFCAGIFILVGFVYRPGEDSRYRPGVSVFAYVLCAASSMQFMSILAVMLLEENVPVVSWYSTAFFGLCLWLVMRARGNVAKIWPVSARRWHSQNERRNAVR